jgi:ankyrin repeat protein
MDSIAVAVFELTVNGDELPVILAKQASGYGAKVVRFTTDDDRDFYADMFPKLGPGCVILQINGEDVLYADFEHIKYLVDPSEREDGTLPPRPLLLLMSTKRSKWDIVRKNLKWIATVLKERWGVGANEDDAEQFQLLCTDFLRCARMGRVDQMRIYLRHNPPVDLDFTDPVGTTALHIAVARKDVAVARFLLKHDADVFMADNNGMTALHVSVAQGSVDLAEMILSKRCARTGGLLQREEAFGRTVVHLCAISGNVEVLQTLIRLGKSASSDGELDLFKHDSQWGWQPLHYAAHYGHVDFLRALLDAGANVYARTDGRKTVVQLAKEGHHDEAAALIEAHIEGRFCHRVLETDTEPWLGADSAELWVGDKSATRKDVVQACGFTVVVSLLSEEAREHLSRAGWMYGGDDDEDEGRGNPDVDAAKAHSASDGEEVELDFPDTPVGEYDEYGLKRGEMRRMGVPWLMYWSDEYQADFYLNARDGTEQWEEPNGADEDVDAGKLADKKTRAWKIAQREEKKRWRRENGFSRVDGEVEYHYIPVEDGQGHSAWHSVLKKLPRLSNLLSRKMHRGHRVLVQCASGRRASVAAILGFLLTKRGLPDDPKRGLPFLRLGECLEILAPRVPQFGGGKVFKQGLEALQDGLDKKRTKEAWARMDRLYKEM